MGKPKGGVVVRRPDVVAMPVGAFAPERLDSPVQEALAALEDAVAAHRAAAPMLAQALERLSGVVANADGLSPAAIDAQAQSVTGMVEKQARTAMNVAKVVDTVARLRSFLAGGVPQTPDLVGKSDAELEEIVVQMALATGRVVLA